MSQNVLCPLDQNPMQKWLNIPGDRCKPSEKTFYQLFWCDKCKYGMLQPRPHQQDILSFYDVEDEPYYTHTHSEITEKRKNKASNLLDKLLLHLAWKLDREKPISASMINRLMTDKGKICDIGSGAGKLLLACQELGHFVVGIEPDPIARSVAISKGLLVEDGTAENLPSQLPETSFDVITMTHVLEHCLNPMLALANVKSLLKPGGIFICEVPNNDCINAHWAGTAWTHLDVPRHLNFFTEKSLIDCIQKTGFEILSTQFRGYCRQFTPETLKTEQRDYNFFKLRDSRVSLPVRPSRWTRWIMLAFSAMASEHRKYDSVIVTSRLPMAALEEK